MLSTDERLVIVYVYATLCWLTYEEMQNVLIHKFKKSTSTTVVIEIFLNKIKWDDSVKGENSFGWSPITPDMHWL